MEQPLETKPISKPVLWTGRVISTLMFLFMAMDAVMKFVQPDPVVKGTMKLGFEQHSIPVVALSWAFSPSSMQSRKPPPWEPFA